MFEQITNGAGEELFSDSGSEVSSPLFTSQNELSVRFTTDGSVTDPGFAAFFQPGTDCKYIHNIVTRTFSIPMF